MQKEHVLNARENDEENGRPLTNNTFSHTLEVVLR